MWSIVGCQGGKKVLEDLPQPWLWPGRVGSSHALHSTTGMRKSILPCGPKRRKLERLHERHRCPGGVSGGFTEQVGMELGLEGRLAFRLVEV